MNGVLSMAWQSPPARVTTQIAKRNAKILRRSLTEAERRLWWHLRYRLPIEGSHFRRQVPIENYVADFCCLSRKLVIEVDGGGHGHDEQATYDAERTAKLEALGFRVLRFSNAEVMRSIDDVLGAIFAALSPLYCGATSGAGVPSLVFEHPPIDQAAPLTPRPINSVRLPDGATPTPNPSPQGGGE